MRFVNYRNFSHYLSPQWAVILQHSEHRPPLPPLSFHGIGEQPPVKQFFKILDQHIISKHYVFNNIHFRIESILNTYLYFGLMNISMVPPKVDTD